MRFGVLVAAAAAAFCTTQPVSAGGGYQGINFVFPDIPPAGLTSAERDFFREAVVVFAIANSGGRVSIENVVRFTVDANPSGGTLVQVVLGLGVKESTAENTAKYLNSQTNLDTRIKIGANNKVFVPASISSVEDATKTEDSTAGVSLDFVYSQIPHNSLSSKNLELLSLGTQRFLLELTDVAPSYFSRVEVLENTVARTDANGVAVPSSDGGTIISVVLRPDIPSHVKLMTVSTLQQALSSIVVKVYSDVYTPTVIDQSEGYVFAINTAGIDSAPVDCDSVAAAAASGITKDEKGGISQTLIYVLVAISVILVLFLGLMFIVRKLHKHNHDQIHEMRRLSTVLQSQGVTSAR